MTITNDVVRMSTTPICNIVPLFRLSGREWTVRSMLTELGPQRTESMVLQYSTKHEPYEARIVLGRVYEGCTGWEQKFPSRPTFGCLAECMKGAWVHTSRLTKIHEEETTILRWECNQTHPHALCYSDWSAPSEFDPTVMLRRDMDMPIQRV